MSGFGETLFGGSPFIRWSLTPFLVLFAVLMPLLIPNWFPLAIAAVIGMEVVCLALLAGFWLPAPLNHVAFRIVAGSIFFAYCAYFLHQTFVAQKPFFNNRPGASPLKALAGLSCIGLPSLWYTLFGRFTFRALPQEMERSESGIDPTDDPSLPK